MAKASKSFKEIVDEEYALKVQKQINYKSDEDEELLLALKLSKEIEENKNIDNSAVSELDEDFVYALQLQEEFDKQREDEDINFMKAKSKQHNFEKITVSFDKHRSIPSHSLTDPFSDEENDDEEDELGGDDNFRSFENNRNTYANRMQSKANKPNGRVAKEIITKHDLEISGKVNAFNLENNLSANFGDLSDLNLPISNNIYSSLKTHADRSESRRIRYHGKEDRETREHVMDPRTRILLYKMLNNGLLSEVGGILSTGKEANVYLGITDHLPSHLSLTTQKSKNDRIGESTEGTYAIKIYKTTLNEFKNRDLYIKYDFRFRYKHNKQNPRKFIAVWAEKERDNLMRMKRVGIRCPEVILLRKHILVLQFIGENGIPAPHLRDVILSFSDEKITDLYLQCILMMRKLFQECKLVHADLSEYNLLYYADQLWVIDVAQAVEHEHPFALSFLKRDCENLNRFFRAAGAKWLMSVKELFIFITDVNITRENELNYLHSIEELCISRGELTDQQQLEDEIFMNSFIPRHLKDVEDPAYEMQLSKDDINLFVFHQSLTGMKSDLSGPSSSPIFDQKISDDDDEEDDDDEFDDEYEVKVWEERPKLTREEQKQLRKEAKKRYKLQKRQNQSTLQNSNNEELTTEQS